MNSLLARAWIILASSSLLLSGFIALIVTGAKMPGIKEHIGNLDIVRWCLVVHVNLATLVWFSAIPMGLLFLSSRAKGIALIPAQIGFLLSVCGIALMMTVWPHQGLEIILSNYIPVLNHPRYLIGMTCYFLGLALTILTPRWTPLERTLPGLNESRFGMLIGSAFFIFAILALGEAYLDLKAISLISNFRYFEIGAWGGGHLIQHACVAFLIVGWMVLLSARQGHAILTRSRLFSVFCWLGFPLFIAPSYFFLDVVSDEYREGFSNLMRWGIAPPVILFLFFTFRELKSTPGRCRQYDFMAFFLSAWLLLLGFAFGALIRGYDMRVPGHYHASIGAVTLTFMALAFLILSLSPSRWMLPAVWCYGVGQTLFAGGMFTAGAFGMPRKTYGAENVITHWGQGLGLGMMAVGGLLALAGGIFFAIAILPRLRLRWKVRQLDEKNA